MNLKNACNFLLIAGLITIIGLFYQLPETIIAFKGSFNSIDTFINFLIYLSWYLVPLALIFLSLALRDYLNEIAKDISQIRDILK